MKTKTKTNLAITLVILLWGLLPMVTAFMTGKPEAAPETPPPTGPPHAEKTPPGASVDDYFGQTRAHGRFWLVPAKTWVEADGSHVVSDIVLKIDTQTGDTWVLLLYSDVTNTIVTFVPVPNSPHPQKTK